MSERYPSRDAYVAAARRVVDALRNDRLLLDEDAEAYLLRVRE